MTEIFMIDLSEKSFLCCHIFAIHIQSPACSLPEPLPSWQVVPSFEKVREEWSPTWNDHPPGHSEESGKVGGVGGAGKNTKEPPAGDQEELGDKMFQMSQKLKYALDSNSFDFAHLICFWDI